MNEKRKVGLRYFLEHIFLKNLALNGDLNKAFEHSDKENNEAFVNLLNSKIDLNSQNKLYYLEKPLSAEADIETLDSKMLKVYKKNIKDTDVMILELPKVEKDLDCSFVAFTKGTNRYFTIEYTSMEDIKQFYPDQDFEPKFKFCEWTKEKHNLYGDIVNNLEEFTHNITSKL